MLDFQQKRKLRQVIYSRAMLVLLLVLVVFLVHSTYGVYEKEKLSKEEYLSAKKTYDNLVAQESNLRVKIDKLGTESGLEEEIRSKFSVGKPGETVVVVVNNTSSTSQETGPSAGFWQGIIDWWHD
ncbi:MAG: septum formation initiator family protein [Candidatus Paceibacterota bacterium]|jgi:cell division protein FtsB